MDEARRRAASKRRMPARNRHGRQAQAAAKSVLARNPRNRLPGLESEGIREDELPRILVAEGERAERARMNVVHDEFPLIEDVVDVELGAPADLAAEHPARVTQLQRAS